MSPAFAIVALRNRLKAKYGHVPTAASLRRKRVPRQAEPLAIQRKYAAELSGYMRVARAAVDVHLMPYLAGILKDRADAWREDAGGKKAKEAVDAARAAFGKAVKPKQLEDLAQEMGERTEAFQAEQFGKQVRAALGVDVSAIGPAAQVREAITDFTAGNVSLITSVSSEYFDQVQQVVMRGVQAGARHEDVAAEIQTRFGVSDSRAALIARDQTLKLYGQLNQMRQEAMGITGYVWRGVKDDRERAEHLEREGNVYQWDDPPEGGHPGFAIQCRCSAEPDFTGALEAL